MGADPAEADVARAQRQLALLAELAAIGMDLARSLRDEVVSRASAQADAGEPGGGESGLDGPPAEARPRALPDYALMYSRLSRAIRLTVALEDRLAEGLTRVRAEQVAAREQAVRRRMDERRGAVSRVVEHTAEAELDDEDAVDALMFDVNERLYDDEDLFELDTRPIGAVAAQLCAELGLSPDWSLWARERWAREEAGMEGSPFTVGPEGADTG